MSFYRFMGEEFYTEEGFIDDIFICRLTHDDARIIGTSEMFESRCDIYRLTDHCRLHTLLCTDSAESHLSSIYTDTDTYLTTTRSYLELFYEFFYLDSCPEYIIGRCLIEDDQYTISEIFIDISTIFLHDITDTIEVDIEEHECTIRIMYLCTRRRESHNIEKHDSECLAHRCTEDDTFISAKPYLIMDLFRDKFFEYSSQFLIVFFEEILLDICTLK